ncbi:unnamed protein product [Prorocentrum cordatum]|uniref:Uncharacterized protein n=1 Tax=Prorocentrum cordatum TaxID=2364126 RepID=A0ABN9TWA9_9DINO|nr:unnamed protein product [Polarella glacialis]
MLLAPLSVAREARTVGSPRASNSKKRSRVVPRAGSRSLRLPRGLQSWRLPPVRAMRPWSLLRRAVVAAAVTTAAASRASGTRHIHADLALGEEQRSSESEVLVTLREGGNPAEWRSVIMKYTSGQEVYSRVDKDGNRVVGFVQQLLASTPDVEELDVGLWGSRPKSDEESRT